MAIFVEKEDWRGKKGLNPRQVAYTDLFEKSRSRLFGDKKFRHGGMAFCPLTAAQVPTGGRLYPADDFEMITLLPSIPAKEAQTSRHYRMAASRLRFGRDGYGNPVYEDAGISNEISEWDHGKPPCTPQLICDLVSLHSVGALFDKAVEGGIGIPLRASIAGPMSVVRYGQWADICVKAHDGQRSNTVVMYRMPIESYPSAFEKEVLCRQVEVGDVVAVLVEPCRVYKAQINHNRNVTRYQRYRDALQLSTGSRSRKEDYLCDVGHKLWESLLTAEEAGHVKALTRGMPPFLAQFKVPLDEFVDQPGWDGIPEKIAREIRKGVSAFATRPLRFRAKGLPRYGSRIASGPFPIPNSPGVVGYKMACGSVMQLPATACLLPPDNADWREQAASVMRAIAQDSHDYDTGSLEPKLSDWLIKDGDPIADLVPRVNYESIGDVLTACNNDPMPLFQAFLEEYAVTDENSPDEFYLDSRYVPESMMPHVEAWFIDFREESFEYCSTFGGFVVPAFPRAVDEYVFSVNGITIDATPSWLRPAEDRETQRELSTEEAQPA